MTEPAKGAKRARFFTREDYLKLLTERYSKATVSVSTRTIHAISQFNDGNVFLTCDFDEKTRVGERNEWIRSHEYIVMRQTGENMVIRGVVAELAFYAPDVSVQPERDAKNN